MILRTVPFPTFTRQRRRSSSAILVDELIERYVARCALLTTQFPVKPVTWIFVLCTRDRFALDDAMKAYDTLGNAAKEGALKVILKT